MRRRQIDFHATPRRVLPGRRDQRMSMYTYTYIYDTPSSSGPVEKSALYIILLLCSTHLCECVCLSLSAVYLIVTGPVRREIHILYYFFIFFYVPTVFRPSLMLYVYLGSYRCRYCLFSKSCACVCVYALKYV